MLSIDNNINIQLFQAVVLAVCVTAVAADFVGLNPEQLARVGRQQEEAVQVRFP